MAPKAVLCSACLGSQEKVAYSGSLSNHKLLFPISLQVMLPEGAEDDP